MQKLALFKALLESPKKVVITTHYKPDADALGSSLGLLSYLQKKGHEAVVISPSDYPEFLTWMEGEDTVINYEAANEAKSVKLVKEADIIFCLDFNNLHRINDLGSAVAESKSVKVLIDHHLEPEDFAEYQLWSTEAAATAELVYELIIRLNDRQYIDQGIAECLYAGIMTDTGQFKHPNTTKNVHLVTADLIELGADIAKVGRYIYDNNSLDRLKFTGYALSKKLRVLKKYRTAYFWISEHDLKKYNSKTGDTEGLVNFALSLKGVVFSAVIIQRPETIRISLRSKGNFSVNDFAKDHFEGGGHPNAAGGKSDLSLEETVKKFEEIVEQYEIQLNKNYKKQIRMNLRSLNLIMAIVVVGVVLLGCQSDKFKVSEDGYAYKYVKKGSGELPKQGEIVVYNMKYMDEKDSVLFESTSDQPALVQCDSNQWNNGGPLYKAFKMIREGDSILIKIPTQPLIAGSFTAEIPPSLDPAGSITFCIGASSIKTQEEMQAEAMARGEEQLKDDIEIIEQYLADNNIAAQSTESGLRYVIEVEGSGDNPEPGDNVKVHYTGTLLDGATFDSSVGGDPLEIVIGRGQVIPGWDEGILLLTPGSKGTLYIPSVLAYGERGYGGAIPPNSVLKFDVELVEVN